MKRLLYTCLLWTLAATVSLGWWRNAMARETEVLWDEWGVPHIYAANEAEMFHALGWAHMQSHGQLILRLTGEARGRAAEYWGAEHLENDLLVHSLGFPELARQWTQSQDPGYRALCQQFVDGMNAYAQARPDAFEPAVRVVLPVTREDISLRSLFIFYTRFVGGRELGVVSRWGETGSNAYAVGPARSASGRAMLVQNPHLPWGREFTFFEAHAVAPGVNVYGVNLVGLPGFGIAFNEYLGWSHTNNTIDNADLYELQLVDEGYRLDGQVVPFDRMAKSIKVKRGDGQIDQQQIEVLQSRHGHILRQEDGKAVAIRFPALDRANAAKQWYDMARAKDFVEFETALRQEQIAFWNVLYADRHGEIFYLFNGHVPRREKGDWAYWNGIIPGDRSADIWHGVLTYDELPKLKNPQSGWLQNANDPPWWCTYPPELKAADYAAYVAPSEVPYYFRPQRSARMLHEDQSITFDELVSYKLSTRMEMADRLLDDLSAAVDRYGDELAREAKQVLLAWDRCAEVDSQGALLFLTWAHKFNAYDLQNYERPWRPDAHFDSPDGLSDPARAARLLSTSAAEIKAQWGRLDVPWGEVARARLGRYDWPANGTDAAVGVYRVAGVQPTDDGHLAVRHGDSWVAVIEFGPKVRAKVLLSYGNSSQPDSPHRGDQLELFSAKQLRDAWVYREDVQQHVARREILRGGSYVVAEPDGG